MDPRRLLSLAVAAALAGCAGLPGPRPAARLADLSAIADALTSDAPDPTPWSRLDPLGLPTGLPELNEVTQAAPSGPTAIARANQSARARSRPQDFVGGLVIFDWEPGRVYEVWTAPLRITTLALEPGETIVAKAAGDTVRWRIGETTAGQGPAQRVHLLIKPLQAGLETNLVLTTDRRTYLIQLLSGSAESFNAAVAWRLQPTQGEPPGAAVPPAALHSDYDIQPVGPRPAWTPTAVLDDGRRTFIVLDPAVASSEAPVLFVGTGQGAEVANYRQSGTVLVLDRLFQTAELRRGGRNPQVVRLERLERSAR